MYGVTVEIDGSKQRECPRKMGSDGGNVCVTDGQWAVFVVFAAGL